MRVNVPRAFHVLAVFVAGSHGPAAASGAASQADLPIQRGIYVADYAGSCSEATEVVFYDGKTYGMISQSLPGNRANSPRAASEDARTIRKTGSAPRGSKDFQPDLAGFTRIWFSDDLVGGGGMAVEARGVKPTVGGGFVLREGSLSARGMEYDDTNYRKCSFSQLSRPMQATVQKYRPPLAAGTTSASAAKAAPARPAPTQAPARIPLAIGYYAYVEGTFSTCAKPATPPWYFDGNRFWEEWDVTDPKHNLSAQALKWEMVASDRFRITYRSRDEDGAWDPHLFVNEYVVTSPQSFTFIGPVGGPLKSNERHQLCAAAQLPAKARWYKGTK